MIKFLLFLAITCFMATSSTAATVQRIFLSSSHQKINIAWAILPAALSIHGSVQMNGKPKDVSVQSNEAIVMGIPGCDSNCRGVLTQDGKNDIFLKVYQADNEGNIALMTFKKGQLKTDSEGNIFIGSTDSDGKLSKLIPQLQFDALYTTQVLEPVDRVFKALGSQSYEDKTQIILRFVSDPTDRKF